MKPLIGITADMENEQLKLKKDYIRAVADAGGLSLIIAPIDDAAGIAGSIDGLVLSGGDDMPPDYYGEALSIPPDVFRAIERERVDFEISLFKEMMKRQKPILAICYGMQMVNVALGGTLYQDIEIQAKEAKNHRQGEHTINVTQSSASALGGSLQPSAFTVNSSHHQAVKNLAHGLEIFALSEDGIIEGFYMEDYPFLVCCQWHPERGLERDGISSALFKAFVEASNKK